MARPSPCTPTRHWNPTTLGRHVDRLTEPPRPRRVVTGNDAAGRSRVMWDGPAPNAWVLSPSRSGAGVHMTPTLDYAIVLDGQPKLWLDDGEHQLNVGDVVVQGAAWHAWSGDRPFRMAYIMLRADAEPDA